MGNAYDCENEKIRAPKTKTESQKVNFGITL